MLLLGNAYFADLDGYATAHGQSPADGLPLRQFTNMVWWWITRNAESEADVDKIREQVWRPPEGEKGEGVWSADAETAAFDAAMKKLGV